MRLIAAATSQPINTGPDPRTTPTSWRRSSRRRTTPWTASHYGVPLRWGPNTLLYSTDKVTPAPTSWSSIYDTAVQGQDHDLRQLDLHRGRGPLPLEDEARPGDRRNPYELTTGAVRRRGRPAQAAAAAAEEATGRSTSRRDPVLHERGRRTSAATWPYQVNMLQADKVPVKDLMPKEGATGWADTWMISSQGEAPELRVPLDEVHHLAGGAGPAGRSLRRDAGQPEGVRVTMDKLSAGSCEQYHADESRVVFGQHQVLEDADRRLRQRRDELHGLQRLAEGLDRDQGLAASVVRRRRTGRAVDRRARRRVFGRLLAASAGCGRGAARSRRPGPSYVVYVGSLAVLLAVGVLDARPVHVARSSTR